MSKEIVNTRTGVGVGIGALFGFMFAGPIGAGVGGLIGGSVAHASDGQRGVMTARRRIIYQRAMERVSNPADLHKVADAFAGEGLHVEAAALRQRAKLRAEPKETQEKRRAYFRKAMCSDNPDKIREIAKAFEMVAASDAAKTLYEHADAVAAAHAAGGGAKPLAANSQSNFADKLGRAIVHFGPASQQAQSAAANLIRARGKKPTSQLVAEVIRIASEALKVPAPAPAPSAAPVVIPTDEGAPPDTSAVATTDAAPADAAPAEGSEPGDPKSDTDGNPPEPTVVGPPAPAVEPPAAVAAAEGASDAST